MDIVGVYLDHLIALRGLKVKAVHQQAGVKPGYISRIISRNIQEPSASILRALTKATGGSWDDVGMLLSTNATRDQAELLAEAWHTKITRMGAKPFFQCPVELKRTPNGAIEMHITLRDGAVQILSAPTAVRDITVQVFAFQREGSDALEVLLPKSSP